MALRDLVLISLAVAGLLWLDIATSALDGAHEWLRQRFRGQVDEILVGSILGLVGLAVFGLLQSRSARRETLARERAELRLRSLAENIPDPRSWIDQIHPEDRAEVLEAFERAGRLGESFELEYRRAKPDGSWVWIRQAVAVLERDADDRAVLAPGPLFDVTDRKLAEEHMAQAEARYRDLVERVPAVTYTWDATYKSGETTVPYISPQVNMLLGYGPDEFRDPKLWSRLVHPDDYDRVMAARERCESGDVAFRSEHRMLARDGRIVWVRDEAVPMASDQHGHPLFQGVMFDITDRKLAEEKLRAADVRYRELVESIPAVTYVQGVGPDAPVTYMSPQLEWLLGYTLDEWGSAGSGRFVESLHPDDREHIRAADVECDRTGGPFVVEYRQRHKDGHWVWVHDEAVLVRDDDGSPLYWQGIRLDITAQKTAEQQVREAEQRYRSLVESMPAVTYVDSVDDRLTTIYVSPQIEDIFGYTPDEWMSGAQVRTDALHPDDRDRVLAAAERHKREGEPFDIEYRLRAKDDRWTWVSDHASVVRDDDGTILFSQGVMLDVTEGRQAEEQLRETEARYRAIVEHVPAATYVDRPDGSMRSLYVSPQIEDIMGVTPQRFREEPDIWLDLMAPEFREGMRRSYLEAIEQRRSWRGEYPIITPDGRDVWVHDETTFVTDGDGAPLFIQGVMFDITERKLAEQALRDSERREREAAERLRALDELKNTFLAAVSHELRSPLTSILGLSLTLEQQELPPEDRGDLTRRLAQNARKLDRLLKDLLDIDRLSRGIVTPQLRPADLGALVRRTVETLELGERDVAVQSDEVLIAVDGAKVERIVENLVMNAVRHTDPSVSIAVRVWAEDDGAVIAVEDDGPGVPADLRDAIFEPFRQGPTASPHAPGTGIGLSLVAMFTELHGGRAWVQEREGGGASFRVFLPTTPAASSDAGNGHGAPQRTGAVQAASAS